MALDSISVSYTIFREPQKDKKKTCAKKRSKDEEVDECLKYMQSILQTHTHR